MKMKKPITMIEKKWAHVRHTLTVVGTRWFTLSITHTFIKQAKLYIFHLQVNIRILNLNGRCTLYTKFMLNWLI